MQDAAPILGRMTAADPFAECSATLRRVSAFVCAVPLLVACAAPPITPAPPVQPPEAARPGTPFAGWWLEDGDGGGAVVAGTIAGPATKAGLLRGDRILRAGGRDTDARQLHALVRASRPGDRLRLQVLRGDRTMEIALVVDEYERWAGPVAYLASVPYGALGLDGLPPFPDASIAAVLAAVPEAQSVNRRLDRMFAELARDDAGFHKLPLIRMAMQHPGAMTDWRGDLVARVRAVQHDRVAVVRLICETLAVRCPQSSAEAAHGTRTLAQFTAAVADAGRRVRDVFRAAGIDRERAFGDLRLLAQTVASDRTLVAQPDAHTGIRAMQASMRVDLAELLAVAQALLDNAGSPPAIAGAPRPPPAVLAGIAEGEILDWLEIDGGYVVVGGAGPNRYAMDRLLAVIDLGGDDVYVWREGVPAEAQTVIDLAGNDRYEGVHGGPGAGWLGVSLLIDLDGDDVYSSALGGCGAGLLGFGLLFDDAGADTYRCAAWSLGAGLYGGGVLIDGGDAPDAYLSESFSQGVGGPRGFGLLVDAGGADLYRANGPVPSAYGTPASFMAFSQGVGVGIRPYDMGGVGALLDFGGDDRFEGGEFSQGGGYYWGVGLLYNEAGNDLYYGNRYAQGFAAHQAFGMLADMAGDDIYWSMTAAGQGAAWDQSIAVLFDAGGNDIYRGPYLSQGAAAQQSRAVLHDVAGDDVYWSSGVVAQGAAGDNSYHFSADDPVHSLGVLFDEAGSDRYSTGLRDGETRLRLDAEDQDTGRGVAGVAMDRE